MGLGPCPSGIEYMSDLDTARFAGNWYEVARDSQFFMEFGYECTTQQYVLNDDGDLDFYYRASILHPVQYYSGIGGTVVDCGTGIPCF
jgi:lipocalin